MKKFSKVLRGVLLLALPVLLALALLALGGLNIAKFALYSRYYGMEESLCKNPGLSDGFVCQGIAACEEKGVFLVCGYMQDKTASRIYITDKDNNSRYVSLARETEVYTGHAGGIATTGDKVYLSNGGKIYTFSLDKLLSAGEGDIVDIGKGTKVNTNASFVFTDDTYLYVGEFHDGGSYVIEGHESDTAEGKHYAYCTQYALTDLKTPVKVYSIRNKVQGMCFMPDGRVVLSTSYGLTDTVYYVYDTATATDSGMTVDGAPLYYLDNLKDEIHGPAMGEDMDFYDGRVITLTEAASNKYLFGKLFGADRLVSLDFS